MKMVSFWMMSGDSVPGTAESLHETGQVVMNSNRFCAGKSSFSCRIGVLDLGSRFVEKPCSDFSSLVYALCDLSIQEEARVLCLPIVVPLIFTTKTHTQVCSFLVRTVG